MRRDLVVLAVALALLGALAVVGLIVVRQAADMPRVSWDSVEADGATVRVTLEDSACTEVGELVVEETATQVILTLHGRPRLGFCADIYESHHEVAELAAPLGERSVYDGACLERAPEDKSSCAREPVAWSKPSRSAEEPGDPRLQQVPR